MSDLIKALQIFLKYEDRRHPTSCDHDVFRVYVNPKDVSYEDTLKLEELGFEPFDEWFVSFKYGSA